MDLDVYPQFATRSRWVGFSKISQVLRSMISYGVYSLIKGLAASVVSPGITDHDPRFSYIVNN